MLDKNLTEKERSAFLMLLHEQIRLREMDTTKPFSTEELLYKMNYVLVNVLEMEPVAIDELMMLTKAFLLLDECKFRVGNQ